MRKIQFVFSIILLMSLRFTVYASADIFQLDEQKIHQELAILDQMESLVLAQQDISQEFLLSLKREFPEVNGEHYCMTNSISTMMEPPLGIPSFVWGCCLGVPGIAIVYFVSEDKDETMKALWGCIASSVGYSLSYVVYIVWISLYWGY